LNFEDFLRKHAALLFSIILLVMALLFRSFYLKQIPNHVENITSRLNHELVIMEKDLEHVLERLSEVPSFDLSNLFVQTRYPYFIFRNNRLFYWSDNRYIPAYDDVGGDFKYRFIEVPEGKFILRKVALENEATDLEILMVLPVYVDNKINNKYLESKFNSRIFPDNNISVSEDKDNKGYNIFTESGNYLFSVKFTEEYRNRKDFWQILVFILICTSIIIMVQYIISQFNRLIRKRKVHLAFLLLILGMFSVRALMLYFNFPFGVIELKLFDLMYYASSALNPSLGDLLLNLLVFLLIAWNLFKHFYKAVSYRKLVHFSDNKKAVFSILVISYSYFQLYFNYLIFRTINFDSQWSLDVNLNLDFTYLKLVSLLIIFINAVIYFLMAHLVFKVYLRINRQNNFLLVFDFLIGTLLFVTTSLLLDLDFWVVTVVNFIYFLVLYFFELPKFLINIRYHTFFYFFLSAMVTAIIGAYSIYQYETFKDQFNAQRLLDDLLIENDHYGEFRLNEAALKIQDDVFIKSRLLNAFFSKEIIEQKIKRVYLSNYFDKYDTQILLFSANGDPINSENTPNYHLIKSRFDRPEFRTNYKDLLFVNFGSGRPNEYLNFIEIKRYNVVIGYIVVRLVLKRIIPNNVYPTLLADQRFLQTQLTDENYRDYSYGIFSGENLTYNSGNFNYFRNFLPGMLQQDQLYSGGIQIENYVHYGRKGENERAIIVSIPDYPTIYLVSNFSFLFLILTLFILSFLLVFAIRQSLRRENLNYATKIQLYSNFSYFLPLLVVTLTTLSIIISAYKRDVELEYITKAENISNNTNIFYALQNFINNNSGPEELASQLSQVAQYADLDINLYNTDGRLMATSHPSIYENNLVSEYINSRALAVIREQKFNSLILDESIGSLSYKATYASIRSFMDGSLIAILSIPFFESRNELNMQVIQVFTNVINIFTIVFIIFLFISYFASKWLTFPLNLITQKIRRTSLSDYNEPLSWNSDDEIGMLVNEYNRMLLNLEESKKALARSEKETAWREMAKQVAHEIKNPLTPMKLTLQHLRRMIQNENKDMFDLVDKRIHTLLHHIDTLSDIAESFSAFAQMPLPETEKFEVSSLLKKTANLYYSSEKGSIQADLQNGNYFVEGDEQWIGRAFSNLIINGFQAVPPERDAEISVKLQQTGNQKICIEISDNGTGIQEDIRDKIFVPNFSTKYAGSGIGLAIAKRAIEHAGGKIWFETESGKGTSFFIELPVIIEN
jgi:signal transduction histidine kinase